MRDNQENSFEHISPTTPPRGLFSRVMKRLGLEKEMALVKRHLGFFVALFIIFLVLSVFAYVGIKQVLAESSFGPFVSLLFSDPAIVIKYWQNFILATFESMPGVATTALFLSMAFLLLFVRFSALAIERLFIVFKLINKQKYEHK
jgi:hypothetical protein